MATARYPANIVDDTYLPDTGSSFNQKTTLDGAASSGAGAIAVVDTSNFAAVGYLIIVDGDNSERHRYSGKTGTSFTLDGTTLANNHASGTYVICGPDSQYWDQAVEEIKAIEGELGVDPAGSESTVVARLDALDTTVAAKIPSSDLLDEDDLSSDSATKPASQQSIKAYVDAQIGGTFSMPSGSLVMYGAAAAPSGWLLCDGTAVSRTTYSTLFGVIGTTYGVGDGATTFNLPDMRGSFPLGKAAAGTGASLGDTGGAIDHTHTYSDLPQHNHSITDGGHSHGVTDGGHDHNFYYKDLGQSGSDRSVVSGQSAGGTSDGGDAIGTSTTGLTVNSNTTGITIQNAGVASPETDAANPPFVVVNFIIKT